MSISETGSLVKQTPVDSLSMLAYAVLRQVTRSRRSRHWTRSALKPRGDCEGRIPRRSSTCCSPWIGRGVRRSPSRYWRYTATEQVGCLGTAAGSQRGGGDRPPARISYLPTCWPVLSAEPINCRQFSCCGLRPPARKGRGDRNPAAVASPLAGSAPRSYVGRS